MTTPGLIDTLDQQTLFEALDRLYHARFTGRVILHFDNGLPHALDLTTTERATLQRWPPQVASKTAPQVDLTPGEEITQTL